MRGLTTVAVAVGLSLAGAGLASAAAANDDIVDVPLPANQNLIRVENTAHGAAVKSPGLNSGNVVRAPVHVPVNVCGNSVNVIGLLNPAFGNACVNK